MLLKRPEPQVHTSVIISFLLRCLNHETKQQQQRKKIKNPNQEKTSLGLLTNPLSQVCSSISSMCCNLCDLCFQSMALGKHMGSILQSLSLTLRENFLWDRTSLQQIQLLLMLWKENNMTAVWITAIRRKKKYFFLILTFSCHFYF